MTTLRKMIDGGLPLAGIKAAAPLIEKPEPSVDEDEVEQPAPKAAKGKHSPMAQQVSNTMQDPVGATKKTFGTLAKKKMEYDLAKEEAMRELAPVQSVLDHVSQMHDLNKNGIPDEMENPDQQFGGPKMPGDPLMQKAAPGKMNPAMPGGAPSYPGVGPRVGQPGLGKSMPQQQQQNAVHQSQGQPAPKTGASSTKKPGQAEKGGMKSGKTAGRGISVSVKAADGISQSASRRMDSAMSSAKLRSDCKACSMTDVKAGGPGSGRHAGFGSAKEELREHTDSKVPSWKEVSSISRHSLSDATREHLTSLPEVTLPPRSNPLDKNSQFDRDSNGGKTEFMVHHNGSTYYVNTEGFNYARYAVRIK